jgi:hypothetical protein
LRKYKPKGLNRLKKKNFNNRTLLGYAQANPKTGIAMSQTEETTLTHHAMLVAWGQYAHCIGLVKAIEAVSLHQKTVDHRPQTKVLEFFVAILGGFEYLKDISYSEHPIDKDLTVARAWGQPAWADHSGVSRTLSSLTHAEAQAIMKATDQVSQPLIDKEVVLALGAGRLELDGDLTPRPVSDTSSTYPGAEYGHMNNQIRLGYQAAIVSMKSPTYGRIGLSATQHSGSTVACTQAEALVMAAERQTECRPLRRTNLLEKRIESTLSQQAKLAEDVARAEGSLKQKRTALEIVEQQVRDAENSLLGLEAEYNRRQRPERPHSKLAKARRQLDMYQRRQARRHTAVRKAEKWLRQRQERMVAHQDELGHLHTRLKHFQEDNANNTAPIVVVFRLDAGFGTAENIALLIELGYEVYTKPHGNWLSGELRQRAADLDTWERVGKNAEMVSWKHIQLDDCPYPLDLACERFWTGKRYQYSSLLHFGDDDVTAHLPDWFHSYNARQTIEAGNKELRQVFEAHRLKVRSAAALQLQEHFALLAANFVRFASHWLAEQCPQIPDGWKNSTQPKVKQQVKVGAHTSAWVIWIGSFQIRRTWAFQPVLPFAKSYFFSSI